VWVIPRAALASLQEPTALAGLSFTDLVFREDRTLWGHIYVGALEQGDTLLLPNGYWVSAYTEKASNQS
jgi:hypothetical protein